jgi:hypothetical protein
MQETKPLQALRDSISLVRVRRPENRGGLFCSQMVLAPAQGEERSTPKPDQAQ